MFKTLKAKYSSLPINKRAALVISLTVFVISILLTFALQIILRQSELEVLDSMRTQFPNYVAARQEILDAFMSDRISRYLSFMPLFAGFNFVVMYYVISYLIGRFYGPVEDILQQVNAGKKTIKIHKQHKEEHHEFDNLIARYNKALADAFQHEEAFEDFMQNAAHEIKTPLFALRTSLDVLKLKDKPSVSAYKNFQSATEVITNRLNRLIESMLIVTKRKEEFSNQDEQDLSQVLRRTIEILQNKAAARKIIIKSEISDAVRYKIQLRFLEAIFTNIIDNAIKYSRDGGVINLALAKTAHGKIEFVCEDNGIGIPESEQSKIFDKFYRATNAINEGVDGSGLGLAVVKRIVEEHQGRIDIVSQHNLGTKITITL
jgi:signal transduction histidine kinase